jgi:hypothetical protein
MALVTENEANAWLGQQTGKHLDYDQQYGQQCFDFFNYYYQFVTGEGPYADGYGVAGAKDIWDVPTDFFDKIPDSRTLEPNVGDVLIYGSSWGAGFGHVEVCRWSDANGCHVIGENEHGDASEGVVEVYRTWRNQMNQLQIQCLCLPPCLCQIRHQWNQILPLFPNQRLNQNQLKKTLVITHFLHQSQALGKYSFNG